ncbi:MAG TPA: GNAT family N-acetyltransferase [Alphaproteobacteria bacterium]|nr:GNAT family N-acetyltransferase [Alphaproteobacteria bacterium]
MRTATAELPIDLRSFVLDKDRGSRQQPNAKDAPKAKREKAPKAEPNSDALIPTIFHEPWWLEKATDGQCQQVEVELGGVPVGRMPYIKFRENGLTSIGMPTLTHFLGPAIDHGPGNSTTRQLRGLSIVGDLLAALPKVSGGVWIKLHAGITDTIAFQEAGFRTDVQFTTEIAPDAEDVLWSRMRDKTRNVIRRAQERFTIAEESDPDRFLAFYLDNLRQRGLKNTYHMPSVKAVLTECIRRGRGKIRVALDESGSYNSAIFTVSDRRAQYYLMSTRSHDAGNGATSMLLWDGIKNAAENNLVFDFDGARHGADAKFFAGFGGTFRPRYWVWKSSLACRALGLLSTLIKRGAKSED